MDFEDFVLAAATTDLSEEPTARPDADCLEYRLDLASEGIDSLRTYDGELPLLVTNRVTGEGGEAPDNLERLAALETAIEIDAVEAIDIELSALDDGSATALRDMARAADVQVVVSTHDFGATPDRETLIDLLDRASEAGDVGKLAVTAQDRGDVLALLSVTHELTSQGTPVATMAMGEAGRHSRAVAPLYGSRIGYAPVDPAKATAPGQYDLATLRELVDRLQSQ